MSTLAILILVIEVIMASEYNQTQSRIFASYAAASFCPASCVQSWTCQTAKSTPPLFDVLRIYSSISEAAMYVGYEPTERKIVTSWRGSRTKRNTIEDITFITEPYACSGCRIHAGFYFDYRSIERDLVTKVEELLSKYPVEKIVCTGHSLGAALSTINGLEFALKYGDRLQVIVHNFGSPRIGNTELAHFLNAKIPVIFRVVHNKDIVPHVPPQFVLYRHAARQVFFDEEMKSYKVCDDSGEDRTCSNQYFPDYTTDDHNLYFTRMDGVKC